MAKKKVNAPPTEDEQNERALRDTRAMKINDPTVFYEVGNDVKYAKLSDIYNWLVEKGFLK